MMPSNFVLIVDDDRNIASVLAHLLRSAGLRVEAVHGAMDAVAVARKDRPQAILMDMMMPGLEGDIAVEMFQSSPYLAGIPIILISAMPEEDARRRAEECGAVDFVAKPFTRRGLLETLSRHLPQAPVAPNRQGDETRVLVVDDDPTVTRRVAAGLRKCGVSAFEAHDAREALRMIRTLKPGLVVSDLRMPGIDGADLVVQIKSLPEVSRIPMLLMSEEVSEEDRMEAEFVGAAALVEKRTGMTVLLDMIRGFIPAVVSRGL